MLTEWWTYRPHDFLMFSPRIYWRLFASINEAWWPLALLLGTTAMLGLAIWVVMWIGSRQASGTGAPSGRSWMLSAARWLQLRMQPLPLLMLSLLAAAWALVAVAFLWQGLTPIFWAAEAAVWAFGLQALGWLMLAWLAQGGTASGRVWPLTAEPRRLLIGSVMASAALGLHPLLAPLSGRPWQQAELFGLAPDPTVIFSLGVLVLLPPSAGIGGLGRSLVRALWLVPLVWCVFSSATLALLGSWQSLLLIAAPVLALWARARRGNANG